MSAVEELGKVFQTWKLTERCFLQHLLTRIIIDVPSFQPEMFVTQLQLLQEEFPVRDRDPFVADQARIGLGFLGELIQTTEAAIQEARAA